MTFLAAAISAPAQVSAPREDLAPQLASDILQDAPVALLVDMTTGQTLVSRNDRHRFLPASVTKVMTLYLAFELIERGKLDPSKPISMRDKTHAEWEGKGSTMFIRQGQEVPLDSILAGIANISANDASMALAESSGGSVQGWTAMMNDEARKLGVQAIVTRCDVTDPENVTASVAEGIGALGAVLNVGIASVVSALTPPPPAAVVALVEDIRVPVGDGAPHMH